MKWEEFLKQNETINGKKVYVVDIRNSDGNSYLRSIEPTLVEIVSNEELPKNKKVYYSNYHFRKIGKTGKTTKQIIAPYDNTGYRSYSGVSVNVFETYEEAVEKYNEQLEDVVDTYRHRIRELEGYIKQTEEKKIL